MSQKTIKFLLSMVIVSLVMGAPAATAASPDTLIGESITTLREMADEPDAKTMANWMQKARGVAIFPSVVKAGVFLGGKYGEGLVIQRDPRTGSWYGPNFISIKGVSYGLQFGVQSTALILVINNEEGMESFRGSQKFTLGGDIGIAAGPVGRQAGASTDVELKSAIYSYSISKGFFAGLSLEGAIIEAVDGTNREYWGKAMYPQEILDTKASDSRVRLLLKELDDLMKKAG
ncbi:MAG: lipid-binding SYLF domain-containing protein [Firmicutes bacterium]|nr:lipid-binding SYLF domain-containing protein [Bacillota bacterium]